MATSKSSSIVLNVTIDGARETLSAFKRLPKDANDELRDAATSLSIGLALLVGAAGAARGGQAGLVAATVKPKRDRVPYIQVGGTKRVALGTKAGTKREAYRILFGSEFGATRAASRTGPNGFAQHGGRVGLWIFPTVEKHQGDINRAWGKAADETVKKFTRGGLIGTAG